MPVSACCHTGWSARVAAAGARNRNHPNAPHHAPREVRPARATPVPVALPGRRGQRYHWSCRRSPARFPRRIPMNPSYILDRAPRRAHGPARRSVRRVCGRSVAAGAGSAGHARRRVLRFNVEAGRDRRRGRRGEGEGQRSRLELERRPLGARDRLRPRGERQRGRCVRCPAARSRRGRRRATGGQRFHVRGHRRHVGRHVDVRGDASPVPISSRATISPWSTTRVARPC